jgi:hypothetical protein
MTSDVEYNDVMVEVVEVQESQGKKILDIRQLSDKRF